MKYTHKYGRMIYRYRWGMGLGFLAGLAHVLDAIIALGSLGLLGSSFAVEVAQYALKKLLLEAAINDTSYLPK